MIAQHCEYAKKFVHIKMMNFVLFESQFKNCSLSKSKNKKISALSHTQKAWGDPQLPYAPTNYSFMIWSASEFLLELEKLGALSVKVMLACGRVGAPLPRRAGLGHIQAIITGCFRWTGGQF